MSEVISDVTKFTLKKLKSMASGRARVYEGLGRTSQGGPWAEPMVRVSGAGSFFVNVRPYEKINYHPFCV